MLTVLRCADHGVADLMVVHDSFATTCGNADVMRDAATDAMVEMYDGYCLYSDLLEQCKARHPDPDNVEWPEVPAKGDLDITKVRESDYFLT